MTTFRWGALACALIAWFMAAGTATAEPTIGLLLDEAAAISAEMGEDRFAFLLDVAKAHSADGRRPKAATLLKQALDLAQSPDLAVQDDDPEPAAVRQLMLVAVTRTQAEIGDSNGACETAAAISTAAGQNLAYSEIVEVLVGKRDFEGALLSIGRIPAELPDTRAWAMAMVAWGYAESGDFQAALMVAEQIAQLQPDGAELRESIDATRNNTFLFVVIEQLRGGEIDGAEKTAERLAGTVHLQRALREIAKAQNEHGDKDAAKTTLTKALGLALQNERRDVVARIARLQAEVGDLAGAADTASKHLQGKEKGYVALLIALGRFESKDQTAADKAWAEGIALVKQDTHGYELQEIALKFAVAGYVDRALELAAVDGDQMQGLTSQRIVDELIKKGDLQRAQAVATSIEVPYSGSIALTHLAAAQAKTDPKPAKQSFELAVEAAKSMEIGGASDVIVLYELGEAQARAGFVDAARRTFDLARAKVQGYPDKPFQAGLYQDIARSQAAAGDADGALAAARKQDTALLKARSLLGVAEGLKARSMPQGAHE